MTFEGKQVSYMCTVCIICNMHMGENGYEALPEGEGGEWGWGLGGVGSGGGGWAVGVSGNF